MSRMAPQKAAASGYKTTYEIPPADGFAILATPTNPTTIKPQRRKVERSPRSHGANAAVKSGFANHKVTAVESDSPARPEMKRNEVATCRNARKAAVAQAEDQNRR